MRNSAQGAHGAKGLCWPTAVPGSHARGQASSRAVNIRVKIPPAPLPLFRPKERDDEGEKVGVVGVGVGRGYINRYINSWGDGSSCRRGRRGRHTLRADLVTYPQSVPNHPPPFRTMKEKQLKTALKTANWQFSIASRVHIFSWSSVPNHPPPFQPQTSRLRRAAD